MDYEGFENFTTKNESPEVYYSKYLCERFDIPIDYIIKYDNTYIYTRLTKELRDVIHLNKKTNRDEIIKVGNDKERKDGKIIYKIKYNNGHIKQIQENYKIDKLTLGISKIFKTHNNNYIFYIMCYGLKTSKEINNICLICDEFAEIKINCEQCKKYICFECYKQLEIDIITTIKNNIPNDKIIRKCPFCRNIYNF